MKEAEKGDMYTTVRCTTFGPDKSRVFEAKTVTESAISVFVNGRQVAASMASPEMLKEYAAGFLLTEGIVDNPGEIESVMIEGNKVSVITLNPRKMLFTKKTVLSGCGGTATVVDYSRLPSAPGGTVFSQRRISDAVSELASYAGKEKTGEIYYAGAFDASKTISVAGDIGRDNALDKAIGAAFLKGTSLPGCFAAVTGRISAEMVRKCLYAQVPVIVSGGTPTSLACEIASKTGVTIAGCVNHSGMNIYFGGHRIEAPGRQIS